MTLSMKKRVQITFIFVLKELFMGSLYASVFLIIIATTSFLYLVAKTPLGNSLYTRNIAQTSVIYDRTGTHVLYKIHGEENRKILNHDQIPDVVRAATIATEDDNFYSHHGVDFLAIIRALKTDIATGTASQGASTITQQLARSAFLNRDKTIGRKILEAIYAIKIERKYSKNDILDAYLNQVPYGSNAYGIEAAAETYFGKQAKDLTLAQAATLAAMTKAPTYYSPYGPNRDALIQRQQSVLARIATLKLEPAPLITTAQTIDITKDIKPFVEPIEAPHFVFYALDQLRKRYTEKMLESNGLKIYTTLDYDKQKLAETIVAGSNSSLKQYGATNAALVALDPRNGQIIAMVGSKNYFDPTIDGQVNVTTRPRQPGSSFKPFVYAKAFEDGYQPESLVLDAPTNFGPDGSGRPYIPRNYDGRFHGIQTMRSALAGSLNIPAIKTLRAVGVGAAIEMAHRLGITTLNQPERYGLSLVIGGGEVTLLDETSGFSVFANDGKRNPVDSILKIINNKGNVIQENKPANLPVLDSQVARKIDSILSDNPARVPIFGPNNKLFIPGRIVAAKTGTTQEFRDAWTVGFTPDIAVGVWAGNNNNTPMHDGADGSFVAAPIWNTFLSTILEKYPTEYPPNDTFLAYDTGTPSDTSTANTDTSGTQYQVVYYRISTGKQLSTEKALSLEPSKVRIETTFISPDGNALQTAAPNNRPTL